MLEPKPCPICTRPAAGLDVIDFNRSCEEHRGLVLPLSGEPIYYHLCEACRFCWAPSMCAWPDERLAELVNNAEYARIDPDYAEIRPRANADTIVRLFPQYGPG